MLQHNLSPLFFVLGSNNKELRKPYPGMHLTGGRLAESGVTSFAKLQAGVDGKSVRTAMGSNNCYVRFECSDETCSHYVSVGKDQKNDHQLPW